MRSETNVSDGEVKNQNLRKELWKIYFSAPRSTWFTEIKYFEMNVQEIAFFTALCCFPYVCMWNNGLLPQAGKLSKNLISESTLETQSFTDKDRKQRDRREKAERPRFIFLSAFALHLTCSLCVFLFKKSNIFYCISLLQRNSENGEKYEREKI